MSAQEAWVQKKERITYGRMGTLTCPDPLNCYVFGDVIGITTIYKSTDQGNRWELIYEIDRRAAGDDSTFDIFEGYALDSQNLYMTFLWRVALEKSTDGGKTFERIMFDEISLDETDHFFGISMYNSKIGAGITNNFLIHTHNNWENYKAVELKGFKQAGAPIFFVDSVTVAVLKVYRYSHDFVTFNIETEEWSDYNVDEETPDGQYPKVLGEICFVNESLGYAAGFQRTGVNQKSKNIIWKTTNRGREWELQLDQLYDPHPFGTSDIAFKDELHGMALSNPGAIVETRDGGKTWKFIDIPEGPGGSFSADLAWAGPYALITGYGYGGIYRREVSTDVTPQSVSKEKIDIYQTSDELLIDIENAAVHRYGLQIVNLYGMVVHDKMFPSDGSHLFMSVQLSDLNSGMYLCRITRGMHSIKVRPFIVVK